MSGAAPGIALAATLHDPPGALAADTARWLPALGRHYAAIAVACSPPTDARLRARLADAGVDAGTPASNARGPLYRRALGAALASGAARVHYLDFDRALHWVARRPRELAAVLASAHRRPALLVGRTLRAHASHHAALVSTEAVANADFAARLGVERVLHHRGKRQTDDRVAGRVDFLVPSFVLRRDLAAQLAARSRARGSTMYGEWVALLAGLGVPLGYVECAGLDWETPDRHRREVARVGLAAWRRAMSTPEEWALRRAMAADFRRGFVRAARRWPIGAVSLQVVPLDASPGTRGVPFGESPRAGARRGGR